METHQRGGLVRGLGPLATMALAAGNVIGSGIYVIPASLADVAGPVSLVAWVVIGAGYFCLTCVFADLVSAFPISGGPQTFVRRALGDFAGQQVAFLYWISAIISNAAFLTAFIGYLAVFFPAASGALPAFLIAQTLLWSLTLVNIRGVRAGGAVQVVTMALKVLPLLVLAAVLVPHASTANLVPFAPHGLGALLPAFGLVSWLFIGMESVTVPAEEVRDAGPTIRRSAYRGYALATAVYLLVAFTLAFGIPFRDIQGSPSPLAVAALRFLGPNGEALVTLGALISIFGILNGWLLVAGRLPFVAARDGYGPAWLSRIHPRYGTPAISLVVCAVLTGLLIVMYFNRTLLEAYNFVALAATSTALLAIGAACVSEIILIRREPDAFTPAQRRRGPITASIGLAMVVLMIVGAGLFLAFLALASLVIPVAYYVFLRSRRVAGSASA